MSQYLFHTLNPNVSTRSGWTPKSPNPASPGGVAPRLSSILIPFLAVAPSTAGRQALALHRWRRSERNPRPLRSPRLRHKQKAIHWPCNFCYLGNTPCRDMSYMIISYWCSWFIYFLFNLIKSQFSNFPWHLIWPYSLRKSAWNHHVPIPMFQYSVSFWMISPTI